MFFMFQMYGPGPGGFPPGAPGPRGRYPMGFPPGMQGPPRPGYPQRPDQRYVKYF